MSSLGNPTHCYLIPFGNYVLSYAYSIREGGKPLCYGLLDIFTTGKVRVRRAVVCVAIRQNLFHYVEITSIEEVFDELANDRLVLFR